VKRIGEGEASVDLTNQPRNRDEYGKPRGVSKKEVRRLPGNESRKQGKARFFSYKSKSFRREINPEKETRFGGEGLLLLAKWKLWTNQETLSGETGLARATTTHDDRETVA
jgi:hypothetical protein